MKQLFALLLCFSLASAAVARPPSAEQRLAHLTEELQLDAQQQQQVADILAAESTQRDELASKYGLDEAFHQKMRSLHKEASSEINAVLNEQQREEFETMRHKRKHKGAHRENKS